MHATGAKIKDKSVDKPHKIWHYTEAFSKVAH